MKKRLTYLAVALAMGCSASAQALTVDLFASNDLQYVEDLSTDGGCPFPTCNPAIPGDGTVRSNVTGNPLSNIIGGERDISVQKITGTPANEGNTGTQMLVNGGQLSFSNASLVGGEGIVQWDGVDAADNGGLAGNFGILSLDTDGLGGLDVASVANAFIFETLSVDLGLEIEIGVWTDDTNFTRTVVAADGPGVTVIPFANLQNPALCGTSGGAIISVTCGADGNVDMSKLGAIQAIFNINGAQADLDLTIANITTTVPEPAILGLLSFGLIGAGVAGRRRTKNRS